VISKVSSLFFS